MNTSLAQIEEEVFRLSRDEQLWLVERLIHRLRVDETSDDTVWEEQLTAMAADPEIQTELRQIDLDCR